ncbi:MAG TPA: hypothetical protein VFR58_13895, partial [Flavisolibacter sp.]|nr:hypothetical protein [Flavisolibacter sp.]
MESIIAWILVTVFLVLTFLPLVRSDFWTFRILEYPRLQKLVIGILLLGCVLVFEKGLGASFWWLAAILVLCCIYQVVKIFPYTIMARKEMKLLKAGVRSQEVVIFTANVLQDN